MSSRSGIGPWNCNVHAYLTLRKTPKIQSASRNSLHLRTCTTPAIDDVPVCAGKHRRKPSEGIDPKFCAYWESITHTQMPQTLRPRNSASKDRERHLGIAAAAHLSQEPNANAGAARAANGVLQPASVKLCEHARKMGRQQAASLNAWLLQLGERYKAWLQAPVPRLV